MDYRFNPLRHIPDPSLQMYFTLVLFTMWSVYFGFVASYYMGWLGYNTIVSIIVTDERKSELNQIVASVHDSVDEQDDLEPPDLNREEDLKKSA